MTMTSKFETSTRQLLSTKWGRTALCAAIAVPVGTIGGAAMGAASGATQVGMAITAPVSYPFAGFIVGKAVELGFDHIAETENDEVARTFSNAPFGKTLAIGNLAIVPFAPLKIISGLAAPVVGAVGGATSGLVATALFHSVQGKMGNDEMDKTATEFCDGVFQKAGGTEEDESPLEAHVRASRAYEQTLKTRAETLEAQAATLGV